MNQSRGNSLAKLLDYVIGVPSIAIVGLFSPSRHVPDTIKSLAVVSIGCIGDTLLLDGPLRDLKKAHPQCLVTLFVSAANAEIATMLDTVHEVVTLPLRNPYQALIKLRKKQFDVCIDTGQWARISALYTRMIRSRHRIGFATPNQNRHYTFDTPVEHLSTRHEIENFRSLFTVIGANGVSIPTIQTSEFKRVPVEPYVVFHIMPSGRKSHMKEWPKERWDALAQYFVEHDFTVLYTGSPADASTTEARVKAANDPQVQNVAGQLSLSETASVIQKAQLVISVNTGIMHLAAAIGTPLIALNGPTSVLRWGPIATSKKTLSLSPKTPCAPCLNLGFEYKCNTPECMDSIQEEDVLQSIKTLLY